MCVCVCVCRCVCVCVYVCVCMFDNSLYAFHRDYALGAHMLSIAARITSWGIFSSHMLTRAYR